MWIFLSSSPLDSGIDHLFFVCFLAAYRDKGGGALEPTIVVSVFVHFGG